MTGGMIPDRASFITAYREWRVLLGHQAPPLLASVSAMALKTYPLGPDLWQHEHLPIRWPPRQALEAECLAHASEPSHAELPDRDCSCGIYAMKEPVMLYTSSAMATAVGRVALWGRYVEHTVGWRAQYAYPLDLLVSHDLAPHTWALSQAYGIPVRVAAAPELVTFEGDPSPGGTIYLNPTGPNARWQNVYIMGTGTLSPHRMGAIPTTAPVPEPPISLATRSERGAVELTWIGSATRIEYGQVQAGRPTLFLGVESLPPEYQGPGTFTYTMMHLFPVAHEFRLVGPHGYSNVVTCTPLDKQLTPEPQIITQHAGRLWDAEKALRYLHKCFERILGSPPA